MQRRGDELFPAAALAAQQHARVCLRDFADDLEESAHRFGVAEDALFVRTECIDLAAQRRVVEAVLDGLQEPLAADRLVEKVVDAEAHRLDRLRHRRLTGDDDDRRAVRAEAVQQIDAAHAREADVDQEQVDLGIAPAQPPLRLLAAGEANDAVARLPEAEDEVRRDLLVVFDTGDQ